MKVLILAGVGGTRLWPLSRENKPKQFLKVKGENSLLQDTFERARQVGEPGEIYVATGKNLVKEVVAHLSDLPLKNIISEPVRRDNAPAIGLSLVAMLKNGAKKSDTVVMMPSDHIIENEKKFMATLKLAEGFLRGHKEKIVTIGIKPVYPETGYGYVRINSKLITYNSKLKIYEGERFVEKPDLVTAKQYLKEGNYFWNAGIFIFQIGTMLALYAKFLPEIWEGLKEIQKFLETKKEVEIIEKIYPQLIKISLDYGIIEKYQGVMVIPVADLGWNDIGHWQSWWSMMQRDQQGNFIRGKGMVVESENSLVLSEQKLIGLVGMKNVAVVESGDAVLVVNLDKSQKVKELLVKLRERGHDKLL